MDQLNTLSNLAQICAGFFKNQSWEELIRLIVHAGIEATGADRGTVFLVPDLNDPKRSHVLSSVVATGIDGRILNIEDNKGVAGFVYREQIPLLIPDVSKDPRFFSKIDKEVKYETKNILCVPLRMPWGKPIGCLELLNKRDGAFNKSDLEVVQILSLFASLALEQRYTIHDLENRHQALVDEKLHDYDQIRRSNFLQSANPQLKHIYKQLPTYAESDSSVLVQGESGTGKELIARFLHQNSPRANGPFIAVNCSAIPDELFEAELFGVTEGAATGTRQRKGKIELANHGTLFLDEIGELPFAMQSKLLRVLQDKMVSPVGSDQAPKYIDFRLVSATNRDLQQMMTSGDFREDLYYRLSVLNVHLLPLRERSEDLDLICQIVMDHFVSSRGWQAKTLSAGAMNKLRSYPWPGNIRELQNRLENAYILSKDRSEIRPEDISLPDSEMRFQDNDIPNNVVELPLMSLREAKDRIELEMIQKALKQTGGNKAEAGRILELSREGLRKAMKKHKVA